MTITCPHCGVSGQLDDSKRPVGATSINCPRCKQSFPLPPLEPAAVAPPVIPVPPPLPAEPAPLRPCPACGGIIEGSGGLCNACEAARNRQSAAGNGATTPPPPIPPAGDDRSSGSCAVCKGRFAQSQMVRFGDKLVCASCKPTYVQMLAMGIVGMAGSGSEGTLNQEQLLARDYTVEIGSCISEGWQMVKGSMGIVVGASLLAYMAFMISCMIPYLGTLATLFLTGPFMGGIWWFYIRKTRGESATVGDAFGGFGPRFVQLMLAGLVKILIMWGVMLVAFIPVILFIGLGGILNRTYSMAAPPSVAMIIVGVFFVLIGFAAMTYLSVSWLFLFPLVIDKNVPFWPAFQLSRKMVAKQWWMTFLLTIVLGIVATLGAFALIIGLLITAPLAFAALAAHYQKVFGDLKPEPITA
ncbi:MAG: zinc-ribbon domain-containing protein [Geobacteraceae bacterium]|nr:zinc-ribbon domain-containing protein [Geobacteraceae bacterium]